MPSTEIGSFAQISEMCRLEQQLDMYSAFGLDIRRSQRQPLVRFLSTPCQRSTGSRLIVLEDIYRAMFCKTKQLMVPIYDAPRLACGPGWSNVHHWPVAYALPLFQRSLVVNSEGTVLALQKSDQSVSAHLKAIAQGWRQLALSLCGMMFVLLPALSLGLEFHIRERTWGASLSISSRVGSTNIMHVHIFVIMPEPAVGLRTAAYTFCRCCLFSKT